MFPTIKKWIIGSRVLNSHLFYYNGNKEQPSGYKKEIFRIFWKYQSTQHIFSFFFFWKFKSLVFSVSIHYFGSLKNLILLAASSSQTTTFNLAAFAFYQTTLKALYRPMTPEWEWSSNKIKSPKRKQSRNWKWSLGNLLLVEAINMEFDLLVFLQ